MYNGYEYSMKIPEGAFRDINNFLSDSAYVKVTLPGDEALSSLQLKMENVHHKYIVDMMDERRTSVLRSFIINEDTFLNFPYLDAGKYYIRITEDINDNSYVDTGSLLEHRMPERVKYFKINDNALLDIPASAVISQTVDLEQMF